MVLFRNKLGSAAALSLIIKISCEEKNLMSIFKLAFGVLIVMVSGVIQAYAIDQSICEPGSKVVLHPNGSLMSCVLKADYNANEIICKEKRSISFYADGQLQTCDLAKSAKVSGQDCKEFAPIGFYPDGKFKSCIKTTD